MSRAPKGQRVSRICFALVFPACFPREAATNLSPGELESVALRDDRVRFAAVVGVPDPARNNREDVVCVIELKGNLLKRAGVPEEIRANILKAPCSYRADRIVFAPPLSIPFSPNGKLQRKILRDRIIADEFITKDHVVVHG